jgi:hypothetical protein
MKRIHAMNFAGLISTVFEHICTSWIMCMSLHLMDMMLLWLPSYLWIDYRWLRLFANTGKVSY